jgi:hypothetical protein
VAPDLYPADVILTRLTAAPGRIEAAARGLSPAQLRAAPQPGEWSLNELLAHLRACADVWGGNIARVLDDDHPSIRALSPRTWVRRTDYLDIEFEPSFHAYTQQREALLQTLRSLKPEQWQRTATRLAPPNRRLDVTLHYYADSIARHEWPHLAQIEATAQTVRP